VRAITANDARSVFSAFDAWTAQETQSAQITSGDVASAAAFVRRLDVALRAPDAVNIAIAQRVGADLLTFDAQMAAGARALGTTVLAG
jgi:predicted nucleic acid-binding protein